MQLTFNTKQIIAVNDLLKNLKKFVDRKYGTVDNVKVSTNKLLPNTVIVQYEKKFTSGGEQDYEFRIATIAPDAKIEFIDGKFKDIFDRYSFISECKPLDLNNPNEFQKID